MIGARLLLLASVAWLALVPVASADDARLERAKELYRSAAFADALVVLEELAKDPAAWTVEALEYRLFCLIALDRMPEARQVIESMVNTDPFHQLSPDNASPRVRTTYREIRQSMLPGIVRRTYDDAKAAFERRDPKAAEQFDRVLTLLDDPALAKTPAFADLRTLVAGFRDLSKAATAPPAPATVVALPVVPVTGTNNLPAPPPVIYRGTEPGVVPAVAVTQTFPRWILPPNWPQQPREGALEIVIDESGTVTSAEVVKPVHPAYDPQLIKAAMSWKYRPAHKDGVPVRSVKIVNVRLEAGTN
jgi:TonB family protein